MGSGAGGYVTIALRTLLSNYDRKADRLHRVSELSFVGAPIPDETTHPLPKGLERMSPGPPPGPAPVGKLGLGSVRPRDVGRFHLFARMPDGSLTGMGVEPSAAVTGELQDTFGGAWAGYAVAVAPTGGRFRLVADIDLRLRCKRKAAKPFQVIPVVMAFGTDQFVDHYLMAVIVAQVTEEQVDLSVTQPYR